VEVSTGGAGERGEEELEESELSTLTLSLKETKKAPHLMRMMLGDVAMSII